ncbi:MAG: hypothetical protein KBD04_07140 [Proteobacteria bacterium]|nr:hypothetical protein [Pseudomonadota bacterium]
MAALALSFVIINLPALFSGTGDLELNVDGTNISLFSGPITASTVKKTDAGSLMLSHPNNDIDTLEINGGEVVISTPSNINSTSTVVKFNASGTDPVTSEVNTAKLRITEDMNTGLLNFSTDGEIEVASSKTATWNVVPTGTGHCKKTGNGTLEIDSDLGPQTLSYDFDTNTGYFKSGSEILPWPSNFIGFNSDLFGINPYYSVWQTHDTSDQNVSYGGLRLFYYSGTNYGGTPIYYTGDPTIAAMHPTSTIPTSIAGIDIDEGTLYVHGGTAPGAPISISSIAKLKIAGNADTEVAGDITVQTGGNIEVEENVKVGDALSAITIYTFDTIDGYYKSGGNTLAWPLNFTSFAAGAPKFPNQNSNWYTNDTTNQGVSYGGLTLNFWTISAGSGQEGPNGETHTYYTSDSTLSATHPTTTAPTGMDVALPGSVSMESGAKINLKANSTWAHDITVTPVI